MARTIGHLTSPDQPQQDDDKQCWICLQSEETELIAPCQCTGSMKWVHRPCLNRWRVDATNPKNFTNCRHCDSKFRLVLRRDPTHDESAVRARKQRFLFKTVSSFIMMCTLLQLALVLLAMGIRAVDPKEELVKLFDFHQIEDTPPAGEGDYWNAIRHHKSTYYVAAVFVGLFFTGVIGTFMCCLSLFKRSCDCDPCPGSVGLGGDPVASYFCMRGCGDCCAYCGDCCFFCGRGDSCPDCSMDGTCLGSCCGTGNCDNCCPSSSGGGDSDAGMCLVMLAVVVIAFVLVGLILVFMALVAWLQKVIVRYLQIAELRHLTGEYVVEDLSGEHPAPSNTFDIEIPEVRAPLQENMDIPSAPPAPSSCEPLTDSHLVHQSLKRDLQAVYGRDMSFDV